jgi:hypothetical protein
MDLLIPASGFATRMNNIPKFLLPVNKLGVSLLETHISNAEKYYDSILVGIRSGMRELIDENKLSIKVRVHELNTASMTETVLRLIEKSDSQRYSVVMPDTYFLGEAPHTKFKLSKTGLMVAAWDIRPDQRGKLGQLELVENQIVNVEDKNPNCTFTTAWGAMCFTRDYVSFLDPTSPHIGYALNGYLKARFAHEVVQMKGEYFDCGTPDEYFKLINRLC